jgi:predicted DCC family thiol-disulfide oxidoreductase YuxK
MMTRADLPNRLTLIFDGECGFCTRCVRVLRALDRAERVKAVPFQKSGVPEAVGLTRAACARSAWVVTPEGERWAGAAAINLALAVALITRVPLRLYHLPVIHQLEDWLYAWVAARRHLLPGDTPYCRQRPAECAPLSDFVPNGMV